MLLKDSQLRKVLKCVQKVYSELQTDMTEGRSSLLKSRLQFKDGGRNCEMKNLNSLNKEREVEKGDRSD